MRLLGRLLVLLLLLGGAGAVAVVGRSELRDLSGSAGARDGTIESIAYALDGERWTRFPFSNPPRRIRLLTHADIAPAALGQPDGSWPYSIEYQVLDAAGAILLDREVNLRTRVPVLWAQETGEAIPATTYADGDTLPTTADLTTLDLAEPTRAAAIRLRIGSLDPALTGAAARVYERRPVRDRQIETAWARMSPQDRRETASGNVFPPSLVSDAERAQMIRNAWYPIGPSGVAGTDFTERTLVARDEGGDGAPVAPPEAPSGVIVGPDRRVAVELPEGGGRLRFTAQPAGETPEGVLTAAWYGRGPDARSTKAFEMDGAATTTEAEFEGGLLDLSADIPTRLSVALVPPGGTPRDLTAELGRLRVFRLQEGEDLVYPVFGGGDAVPFRLVLRCACFGAGAPASPQVTARFAAVAEDGRVLDEGDLTFEPVQSAYDWLADTPEEPLSEPSEAYFNLPPETAELRLASGDPLLAVGFNRPPGLERRFLIPETYFADGAEEGDATWFYVRPAEWDDRVVRGLAPLIVAPQQPPEDDPEILAGRYAWEQFVPEGDWLARDLLIPQAPEPVTRSQALGSSFARMSLGEELQFDLASPLGAATVAPDLVYIRTGDTPARLEVLVDGSPVLDTAIGSLRGAIPLPDLPAGPHRVEVRGPEDLTAYLSNAENRSVTLVRRRAFRIPEGETTFAIEKRSEEAELIVGRVYPSTKERGRQVLDVTLEDPVRLAGPLPDWTLADREYSLRLDPGDQDVAVLGADQMVGPARRLLIPLGGDLPAGRYRLRVDLAEGPEIYLSLTRTVPGVVPQRDVVQE